jgi:type IV secretory pathway TrbF-like protein
MTSNVPFCQTRFDVTVINAYAVTAQSFKSWQIFLLRYEAKSGMLQNSGYVMLILLLIILSLNYRSSVRLILCQV